MDIKAEGINFFKTLGMVIPIIGGVWGYTEPIVEDYIHEQIKIVQEEDKRLIEELKKTIDADYNHNIEQRNEIIEEIKYIYPGSRLKTE